jgi:hypothetical protein
MKAFKDPSNISIGESANRCHCFFFLCFGIIMWYLRKRDLATSNFSSKYPLGAN